MKILYNLDVDYEGFSFLLFYFLFIIKKETTNHFILLIKDFFYSVVDIITFIFFLFNK
jgi:hypothetical protein